MIAPTPSPAVAAPRAVLAAAPHRDAPPPAGRGWVEVNELCGRSRATRLRAHQPLRLLAPRSFERAACLCVSSFGGGLVAGDHLHLDVTLGRASRCLVTTQASTKVYRPTAAHAGASQIMHAHVADDALLVAWPDPITCYAHAIYEQRQRIELAPHASALIVDCLTSGRRAHGEHWAFDRYLSRNELVVAGRTRALDTLRLDRADGPLDAPFRMGGHACYASVIAAGPLLAGLIETVRRHAHAAVPTPDAATIAGVSDIDTDGDLPALTLRAVAHDTTTMQTFLRQCLADVAPLLGDAPWHRKW